MDQNEREGWVMVIMLFVIVGVCIGLFYLGEVTHLTAR